MNATHHRKAALRVAGWLAVGALLGTAALAAPPKGHKAKPPAKGGGNAALIAQGKKVYADNHCSGCHAIAGKGGKSGPDLTHTGKAHNAAWIEAEVKDPKSHNPKSRMPAYASKIQGSNLKALATYLASLK
ncbi:MAG TPA: cytochrome c [Chthonomonadaceae bacterium]|nr:cytochrome c [Chthonomonadaceae bacterium]